MSFKHTLLITACFLVALFPSHKTLAANQSDGTTELLDHSDVRDYIFIEPHPFNFTLSVQNEWGLTDQTGVLFNVPAGNIGYAGCGGLIGFDHAITNWGWGVKFRVGYERLYFASDGIHIINHDRVTTEALGVYTFVKQWNSDYRVFVEFGAQTVSSSSGTQVFAIPGVGVKYSVVEKKIGWHAEFLSPTDFASARGVFLFGIDIAL